MGLDGGLHLSRNQIKHIADLIELALLEELNISGNGVEDISILTEFKGIANLDLTRNNINDISALKELSKLKILNLSNNQIKNIDDLSELKELTSLILRNNQICDISGLTKLVCLERLYLSFNQIENISPLKNLDKIELLYLVNNQISDISDLRNLKRLTAIDLSKNHISDISPLQDLKLLDKLDLQDNLIKEIPVWLTKLKMRIKWTPVGSKGVVSLFNNPIESPPIEIIEQGTIAIQDWLLANKKKLNEIKILLIGDAKAGKTSICRKLKYNLYDAEQQQTNGIVIETFKFDQLETFHKQNKLHATTAYFWDFGGQEIMSSTHQFFMTKRSVYLLVLEARKDLETDKQVRQWLERIQAFGGNSPVIVVGNKIDLNPSFGLDTTILQKDFPQIKYFINVSCNTGEKIHELKSILEEWIPRAELFNTQIDERWIDIKTSLLELIGKEYKISHVQFVTICKRYGLIKEDGQAQAIKFLNDLGIVLHFDELNLSEYYVLDPLWVTTGVYRIITSEKAARQKGEIAVKELSYIVNEEFLYTRDSRHNPNQAILYSPNECKFLADIMVQFKLGYYTDHHTKLLIPDLLDKETPKAESESFYNAKEKLSFVYSYKYMPTAIMPRIIVELKEDAEKSWRTGVMLNCKKNIHAEAMIASVENRLHIIVLGEHKQKRDYLSVIRYAIDEINSTYNVEVDMLIPLPGYEKNYIKYEHLLKLDRKGRKIFEDLETDKEFEISMLLDGIANKEEVQKQATMKKLKIFLASSSELKEDRIQFEIFINRKNNELIDSNIFIELVIWEDFLDAVSTTRLQDEYNKAIKSCDIFVMLFFTKVGMYTAEEFETAFRQFKQTSKPIIYTYFKNDSILTSNINRNDLLSLLTFKDKLKELGHFETHYNSIDELKFKFNNQLTKYFNETP